MGGNHAAAVVREDTERFRGSAWTVEAGSGRSPRVAQARTECGAPLRARDRPRTRDGSPHPAILDEPAHRGRSVTGPPTRAAGHAASGHAFPHPYSDGTTRPGVLEHVPATPTWTLWRSPITNASMVAACRAIHAAVTIRSGLVVGEELTTRRGYVLALYRASDPGAPLLRRRSSGSTPRAGSPSQPTRWRR